MPTIYRTISSTDTYHVVFRGSGKQIIFETDDDRVLFLKLLNRYLQELGGRVFAWILMSDHVHMVLRLSLADIATLMEKLGATYFRQYNKSSERSGRVLQGAFFSEAINTDEYLMTCIRYVHQNIEKARVCKMEEYRWSSYRDYVGNRAGPSLVETETAFVLAVFDGLDCFAGFHSEREYAVSCIDIGKTRKRMNDDEALVFAKSLLGEDAVPRLRELDKPVRDGKLRELRDGGLSIRQIERLTGIGRGIINRV